MTGMEMCKARLKWSKEPVMEQGARAQHLDAHADVRQTEHSSSK